MKLQTPLNPLLPSPAQYPAAASSHVLPMYCCRGHWRGLAAAQPGAELWEGAPSLLGAQAACRAEGSRGALPAQTAVPWWLWGHLLLLPLPLQDWKHCSNTATCSLLVPQCLSHTARPRDTPAYPLHMQDSVPINTSTANVREHFRSAARATTKAC